MSNKLEFGNPVGNKIEVDITINGDKTSMVALDYENRISQKDLKTEIEKAFKRIYHRNKYGKPTIEVSGTPRERILSNRNNATPLVFKQWILGIDFKSLLANCSAMNKGEIIGLLQTKHKETFTQKEKAYIQTTLYKRINEGVILSQGSHSQRVFWVKKTKANVEKKKPTVRVEKGTRIIKPL